MGSEPWAGPSRRSDWFKSSFSNGSGTCVEVRFHDDLVSVRDSKHSRGPTDDPHPQPVITVTAEEWTAFLDELAGPTTRTQRTLIVESSPDGSLLRATGHDTTLQFTHAEWRAYLAGVRAHEFDCTGHRPHPS